MSEISSTRMRGTVSGIVGDLAIVDIAPTTGCGRCHEPGGCGGGLLTGEAACKRSYRVANSIGAVPGDSVIVSIQDGRVLATALWMYGLPLLFAIMAAIAVAGLWHDDALTAVATMGGLILGFVLLRRRSAGLERQAVLTLQPATAAESATH